MQILTELKVVVNLGHELPSGESPYNAGDTGDVGLTPGLGRSPGGGHGNPPLWYSCLENPVHRGAWWATVCKGCKELNVTEATEL